MIKLMRSLVLFLVLPLMSLPALAKPKHKTTHKSTSKSHKVSSKSKSRGKKKEVAGVSKSDLDAKAIIRKKAPLVLEERFRGDNIRLNKDGTFSREGERGSFTSQGHWKVKTGRLRLKWNTGEEYGYRVTFKGKTPVVNGQKPNKSNHYILHSAD